MHPVAGDWKLTAPIGCGIIHDAILPSKLCVTASWKRSIGATLVRQSVSLVGGHSERDPDPVKPTDQLPQRAAVKN